MVENSEKRICIECNKKFIFNLYPSSVKLGKGKFCSKECSHKSRAKNMIGSIPWNKDKKMPLGFGHKISKIVSGRKLTQKQKDNLSLCLKGIKRSSITKERISLARRGNFIGEKSNFWKGGKMKNYPELFKIRMSLEYKLWRKSCFERDNFTCQKTGQIGGQLQVHHINNFIDFPELRTSIENGITLSKKIHNEFHKKYGIKNNTKEQLIEFLKNE